MANYNYDEGGSMAAYFLITFLALVLTPLTLSAISNFKKQAQDGCMCQPCIDQRLRVAKRGRGSLLNPKLKKKTVAIISGWVLFAYLCFKAADAKLDNKLYDPFEILGISSAATEQEIKKTFKNLSRMYHPDKVKLSVNMTIEMVQDKFVEITKAYKALTDETIRQNWELYGNPDGRQQLSMGIALPHWIIESKNNIWVLGIYGIVFGGALPSLVGRWWFGSRQKTKDGINARSAAALFKSLKEESNTEEVVGTFGQAYEWDYPVTPSKDAPELDSLEKDIKTQIGDKWRDVKRAAGAQSQRRRALILLYSHLLRIPITKPSLENERTQLLLHTPVLLSAVLGICISRNWLAPTLSIMRFHAYLAQAIIPDASNVRFDQLPGIERSELKTLAPNAKDIPDLVQVLREKNDERLTQVQRAADKWGQIELVDASFRVIGERIVVPSSIVFLVVKLRVTPPTFQREERELNVDETKRSLKLNEEKDIQFLNSRKDAEDLSEEPTNGWAHAPFWPGNRKPSWWLVLADIKANRVVVPPMKITDVPLSQPEKDRDYRSFKLQFQAPPNTGLFTWKLYVIGDTFVGGEVAKDMTLKIDDVSALTSEEQAAEDEISEPDEDSLAGQMAAMRGGPVKKRGQEDEESDEESSTDDDKESEKDSSDSDSD